MPNPYDANFATEPPADLPYSAKVKGLRKAYQTAVDNLNKYRQENAPYAERNIAQFGTKVGVPALVEAERELREQEIAAIAAGKPLPDKDAFLGPVKSKAEEYKRMVPTLEALARKAQQEYSEALREDLVPMGLKEAQKAAQARDAYEKAYRAMLTARETLERHAVRFTWCATAGQVDTLPLEGSSAGNNAEAWQIADDGRLTTQAAIELGFEGIGLIDGLVVMSEPVRDEAAEAEAEFWRTYKPKMFTAQPAGYASNWDH
ncbi:hypothetical protein [Streptomyces sp. DSM 118148]|uniref:hypothetical protein n=1 Tax=Streptomyces sp. DSM 118148 TaxID=3448667 RepID=UPI00404010AD